MTATLSDVDLLARLVGIDTTSSRSNLPLAELLADYLERPGVRIHWDRSPDTTKANLVVRVGPESAARRGLVLSGHMDVVPADEEGWESDPFTLTGDGERLRGRGSADMKGFVALAANLARELEPGRLAAPLVLLLTYDEEVGTLGSRALLDGREALETAIGPLPQAAVIGEPTELAVARLHKGHAKLRITLTGRSAHSGYPHLGINAIEAAARAVSALAGLRRELAAERPAYHEHFPEVPFVPLNVGTVHGGAAVNVVPDRCVLEVGARVLPGMDSAAIVERIRRAVAAAVAGDPAAEAGEAGEVPVAFEVLSDSPPLASPADSPIHRHLCVALGQGDGEGCTRSVSFATDAGWLQRLGLDCVIWGPGSITAAHRPDESIARADLVHARRRLEELVESFCGSPG